MKTTSVGERIRATLPDAKPSASIERTVRDWLLADEDFNVWFLETTKGTLDDAKLMALLGGYGEDQDEVGRAWDAFEIDRDEGAGQRARVVEGAHGRSEAEVALPRDDQSSIFGVWVGPAMLANASSRPLPR